MDKAIRRYFERLHRRLANGSLETTSVVFFVGISLLTVFVLGMVTQYLLELANQDSTAARLKACENGAEQVARRLNEQLTACTDGKRQAKSVELKFHSGSGTYKVECNDSAESNACRVLPAETPEP